MGSMVGMAVADAFGHWFEFMPAVPNPTQRLTPPDHGSTPQVDQPFSSGHGFSLAKFTDPERPQEEARFLGECFTDPANQFQLALGQWTDDASMGHSLNIRYSIPSTDCIHLSITQRQRGGFFSGLCMADSLIMTRGYNGSDIRKRFWNWSV